MPANGFFKATSVSECRFDFRLREIWISASKNRSSFPANGLLARRAPLAAVWMQPNDSVHQETIRLVSLSLRLRSKMAAVLSISRNLRCDKITASNRGEGSERFWYARKKNLK